MTNDKLKYDKVVDIDLAIANSNKLLFRSMPRFLKNRIKHIIRQDQLNEIHNKFLDKYGIEYVNSLLKEFDIKINVINNNCFDEYERCIFVANHPLGGIDALAFLHCIDKIKGNVVSPSNAFLTRIKNLDNLIIGVNVFGKNSREQIESVKNIFESDAQIMIFPAGTVSRKIRDEIKDIKWKKTFITKAIQTKRYVVPVYISGNNSPKFYRIAKLRKLLGVKLSIETLYLPQEMLKKRGSSINFVFGEPIHYSTFDNSETKDYWTEFVRNKVYQLREFSLTE
jgi:putative hemolysin